MAWYWMCCNRTNTSSNDMLTYIQQNTLQQLTTGYNVQVKDLMPGMTPDDMVVDVYIGVNPNKL